MTAALHRSITVTAGIYIQASPLTLWDWKSEGARESDSEGTASDGSTTQKHYSDSRNIHTSITTHTVGLEERGGEVTPTAKELAVTAALHRSITTHTVGLEERGGEGIRQRGNCQ